MSNVLEYTLSLKDLVSAKLQKIGINNDAMLDKFADLQRKQQQVTGLFQKMGTSVYTLQQRISLLKSERDLLPSGSLSAIRKYNSEINKLERQMTRLQTVRSGNVFKNWASDAFSALPAVAMNPIVAMGAGVGYSIKKGMEVEMQKTNITTLLKGDVQKSEELFKSISNYQLQSPYNKSDLIDAQKTMMGFGISSEVAFERLKNLGDIAMGDAGRLSSLTLAFSQASSTGKLMGQDLLQMINAGFNPLSIISERTGESMVSLKKRMGEGKITIEELTQAFQWATDEQGLYYKSAEKASNTLQGKLGSMMSSITEMALKVYEMVSPIIVPLVDLLTGLFNNIAGGIGWLVEKVQEGNPYILGIAGAIGVFTAALAIHNTVTGIASFFQNKLTWAVIKTNLAFLANPVTLIIAGIIALIGVIAYCIYGVSGWGKAWEHTVQGMKFLWEGFVAGFQAHWNTAINAFMIGIDMAKMAWYKFKEAVGLGDSSENQAMMRQIELDMQKRAHDITEGYRKAYDLAEKGGAEFAKAWNSLEFSSFSEVKDKLTGKLGLPSGDNAPPIINNNGGTDLEGDGTGKGTNDKIISGGTRQTHINISIGNLGTDTQVYVSSVQEGIDDIGKQLSERLLRVVNSVNQMQTM